MANEKRLIYAKALAEEIYQLHYYVHGIRSGKTLLIEYAEKFREDVLRAICKAPTVDAVPAVHSKWVCVNEAENVWMCDGIEGCGGEMLILEKTPLENGFGFCPYCGADMRERSEGK